MKSFPDFIIQSSPLTGSSDGTVNVSSTETGEILKSLQATDAEVRSVAVSSDGKQVAAGIRYGSIKQWDTASWGEPLSFQGNGGDVWSIAFSPDGNLPASSDGDWNSGGIVRLWTVADGKPTGFLQHTGEVLSIAFSPDGKSLAAGAADKTVKVWDLKKTGSHD